jgi:hypothetical protein
VTAPPTDPRLPFTDLGVTAPPRLRKVLPEVDMEPWQTSSPDTTERAASSKRRRHHRQERVSKAVWGLTFLTMGVLFTLHEMGKIDMTRRGGLAEFAAEHAVDGSDQTRWSSDFREGQSIAVDLGAPSEIRKLRLNWEKAFAKDYEIQVSDDGSHWTTVSRVTDSDGGIDEQDVSVRGRYLRVSSLKRATPWGISLWELDAFGPDGALLTRGRPAHVSSREGVTFGAWPLYWPVLLIASGLPLVLAPKDGSQQVVGLVMAAAGTYWQLRNLDLVTWGFRESASVFLIVAGLLILVQSLKDGDGGGETAQ